MQKFAACGSAFSISFMLSFRSLEERVAEFACVCSVWFLLLFSFPPREMLAFVSFFSCSKTECYSCMKELSNHSLYLTLICCCGITGTPGTALQKSVHHHQSCLEARLGCRLAK